MAGTGSLSYVNYVDSATITATSELASQPVANVAEPSPSIRWSTTGTTSASLKVDFGSLLSTQLLCLVSPDLIASDTVHHKLSAVSMGATDLLTTGAIACGIIRDYDLHAYVLSAAVSARYWQVDISAPSLAAAGRFRVGRAWAGALWNFDVGVAYGWSEAWADESVVERADYSGVEFVEVGARYRTMSVSLDFMSAADRTQAREVMRYAGRRRQVVLVRDRSLSVADQAIEGILGRLQTTSPVGQPNPIPDIYATSFQVAQSL